VLKKFIGAVVAPGALSIPLAGVAWGDAPTDPGSNGHGVGAGGIPRVIGDNLGSTDPIPPGSVISDVAQQAEFRSQMPSVRCFRILTVRPGAR
jgi:hypothetical protein